MKKVFNGLFYNVFNYCHKLVEDFKKLLHTYNM